MGWTHLDERGEGARLEAITSFQSARDAEHDGAARLLRTSSDPKAAILTLLRVPGVYLRREAPDRLDRLIAAPHRAGPPSGHGPSRPPLI